MSELEGFSPEEQRYFDTRGADGPSDGPADGGAASDASPPTDMPAAEAVAAPAPAPADKDGAVPRVPIHALHEARAEARELRERIARQEERFRQLVEQVRQPAPDNAAERADDPVATLKRLNATMEQRQTAERQAGALA